MSVHDIDEAYAVARVAVSAYHAFRFGMANKGPHGQELPHWNDLPPEAQDGWLRATVVTIHLTEDASGVAWGDIAKSAYEAYSKAVPWEQLDTRQWFAWQAAARHILNVTELDQPTEDGIEDMEAKWLPWVEQRMTLKGGTQ